MGIAAVLPILVGIIAAAHGGPYDSIIAYPGLIPYQAAIFGITENILTGNIQYDFECSGALIHNEFVLTTASCVDSIQNAEIAVAVGIVEVYNNTNTRLNATEIIKHFMYVPGEPERDIALLKISPGFLPSEFLSPVFVQEEGIPTGTTCTVSGWKRDLLTVGSVLRYANATVFERSQCTDISAGEVCAGATEEESPGCQLGDEGSPIVCNGRLTGLMHYDTASCLSPSEPGVFGDVAYHKDWIRSHVDLDSVSTTAGTTTSAPSTTPRPTTTEKPVGVYETVTASVGDVPYQAAVGALRENPLSGGFSFIFGCGGSVVDQQFVLTTVSCAELASMYENELAVAGGFVKLYAADVEYHNVTQVIRHPDYDDATGANDIALLRVTPGFTLSANLSAIALSGESVTDGSTCRVSGWKEDLFSVNSNLKYGNVSTTACEGRVNDEAGEERSRTVCGGIPDEDAEACLLGDEGAPLVCSGLLTGLFHNSFESCLQHSTGKYHDISAYKQWITEQMATPAPSTTDGTPAQSSTVTTTPAQPITTTLSTTDHTTGQLGGGEGSAGCLSSSVVAMVMLSVMTYLNVV